MKKDKNISGRPLRLAVYGHKHALMSREGGIEVVVGELVTRMAKKGIQVTCYDRKSKHVSGADLETPKNIKGIKIVPVWTINRRGLAALTSSYAAAIKAALSDADVVHIHGEGPGATCWIPKLFGKRTVLTCHGACEIIGTTGEKPVKSRLSENSVFYPNLNTEYRIKKLYSGFLKRFCAMPEASWCTHRAFSYWNPSEYYMACLKYAATGAA